MTTQKRCKGLTLIEIVCVVAVAGVLLPTLIYAVGSFFEASQQTLARIDRLKSAVHVVELLEHDLDHADKLNDSITYGANTLTVHSREPIIWTISERHRQHFIARKSILGKMTYGPFDEIKITDSNIANASQKNFQRSIILQIDDVKKPLNVK